MTRPPTELEGQYPRLLNPGADAQAAAHRFAGHWNTAVQPARLKSKFQAQLSGCALSAQAARTSNHGVAHGSRSLVRSGRADRKRIGEIPTNLDTHGDGGRLPMRTTNTF
jgi:hypothetical protein